MYIVSSCLLGENCKYNGGNNYTEWVDEFCKGHNYIAVCPELEGGLKSPRCPVEIVKGRAINAEGIDVTKEFVDGCKKTWCRAELRAKELNESVEGAILKAKSPSCGSNHIYDGTFSHTIIAGDGFFTKHLKEKNIKVISELEGNPEE